MGYHSIDAVKIYLLKLAVLWLYFQMLTFHFKSVINHFSASTLCILGALVSVCPYSRGSVQYVPPWPYKVMQPALPYGPPTGGQNSINYIESCWMFLTVISNIKTIKKS